MVFDGLKKLFDKKQEVNMDNNMSGSNQDAPGRGMVTPDQTSSGQTSSPPTNMDTNDPSMPVDPANNNPTDNGATPKPSMPPTTPATDTTPPVSPSTPSTSVPNPSPTPVTPDPSPAPADPVSPSTPSTSVPNPSPASDKPGLNFPPDQTDPNAPAAPAADDKTPPVTVDSKQFETPKTTPVADPMDKFDSSK